MTHDIIVIGASAGGLDVLLGLAEGLPADLPASLFIVVHMLATERSLLPELLASRGALPTKHPLHAERILPGHIYVAVPDNQLLVRNGFMEVVRGPKENGHRPAVDALFRSASTAYGPRVVGVVLSGNQDCGTAGMASIKARGGVSVVQAPETSAFDSMPRSVLEKVAVDHVVRPADLAPLLVELAHVPAGQLLEPTAFVRQLEGEELGNRVELVCPLCQGALTEAQPGVFQHFRCHVGHAFSLESLVREQGEEMERTLWAAVRSLEEGAALSRRLAVHAEGELERRFVEKSATQTQQAELIKQILLHGALLSREDAPDAGRIGTGVRPSGHARGPEPVSAEGATPRSLRASDGTARGSARRR
jgi:two-component system, chemotaxis family, protein-glutamate methylesterase/glutaminase